MKLQEQLETLNNQIEELNRQKELVAYQILNTQQATDPAAIQTCPSRMSDLGPWEHEEGLDRWELVGQERCCSFCGSIHPEDVNSLLDLDNVNVEVSDNRYKAYIRRSGVSNASEGGIKYYVWHKLNDDAAMDALLAKINAAAQKSMRRLLSGLGQSNPRAG